MNITQVKYTFEKKWYLVLDDYMMINVSEADAQRIIRANSLQETKPFNWEKV
jgi:hypothetical protein